MAPETKFKETEIGMIPEDCRHTTLGSLVTFDWRHTTLGSLVTFQRGHDLTFENKVEGPYPIVSSSGILKSQNIVLVRDYLLPILMSGKIRINSKQTYSSLNFNILFILVWRKSPLFERDRTP